MDNKSKNRNKYLLFGLIILTLFVSGCQGDEYPYEIQGDSVVIDDAYLFMNVTPHTIHHSDWIYLDFESKLFTGDIDFAFGFNTSDGVYPLYAERFAPHNVEVNYTCDYLFRFTTNPNYFWCYYTLGAGENGTEAHNVTVFEHSFLYGDIPTATAFWNEIENWTSWQPANSVEYDFLGMDTWYYTEGQHIEEDVRYKIRYYLEVPYNTTDGKYNLAIKPSSETIQEAIENEHFWYLDPWYDYDLNTGLISYYTFDDADISGTTVSDKLGRNDLTLRNTPTTGVTGKLGEAVTYNGVDEYSDAVSSSSLNSATSGFSVSFWMKRDSLGTVQTPFARQSGHAVWFLNLEGTNIFRGVFTDNALGEMSRYTTTTFTDKNNFVHVVVTFDEGEILYYLNGSLANMDSAVGSITAIRDTGSAPFEVGRMVSDGRYFNGTIDEVGLWNRTLTPTEVSALWNGGAGLLYEPVAIEGISIVGLQITPAVAYANTTSLECSAIIATFSGVDFNATINWSNSSYSELTAFNNQDNGTNISANITQTFYYNENWNCTIYASYFDNAGYNSTDSDVRTISDTSPVWVNAPTNQTVYNTENVSLTYLCSDPDGSPTYSLFNFTSNLITPLAINSTTGIILQSLTYYDEGGYDYNVTCSQNSVNVSQTLNLTILQGADYNQRVESNPVSEGSIQTFYLDIIMTNSTGVPEGVVLQFNGSSYDDYSLSSGTVGNTNYYNYTIVETMSNETGAVSGAVQYYNWTYNITGSPDNFLTDFETTSDNFTVYSVEIDNCSVYGDTIFGWTLKDENTNVILNASENSTLVELELILSSILDPSITWNYSNSYTDIVNSTVCVPSGLLNNTNYTIDITMSYESIGRVVEFYLLDDGILSSSSNFNSFSPKAVDLLDLLIDDSTTFLFSYLNENGLSEDDIIIITYRKYIGEGLFREVERSREDNNGETHIHLLEEDAIYYFLVTQRGEILYQSDEYIAICQALPCSITLQKGDEFIGIPTDYDQVDDGYYAISTDTNSRVVTLTFSASNTSRWNLTIYKYVNNVSQAVVQNSSSTLGDSGTVNVGIPLTAGNVTFVARVYRDDDFIIDRYVDLTDSYIDEYRTSGGIILGALIALTMGLMAVTEGIAFVAVFILGVVFAGLLGLFEFQWLSFILLLTLGGILIWKLSNKD